MPRIPWRTPPWNERNARPPCLRCGEYREDQPIPKLPIDADAVGKGNTEQELYLK